MVQTDMEFDGTLGRTEIGPWKNRQAKVYGRGIQRIKRIFKAKIMTGRHPLTPVQEFPKQGLIQSIGFIFVDARQIGTGELCAAEMIKTVGLCGDTFNDITQAVPPGQLSHGHRHKLRPPGCGAETTTGMMLIGKGLEFMSRDQFE